MRKTDGFAFRARRRDNNEWTYGCLLGDSTIIPTGQEFEIEGGTIYGCNFKAVDVIPSTVVPLFDKNETIDSLLKRNEELGVMLHDSFQGHLLGVVIPELEKRNEELEKENASLRKLVAEQEKYNTNAAINKYNTAHGGKGMITCSECQYSDFGDNDYIYCRRCRRTVNECFFCASDCRKTQQEKERIKETER